MNIRQPFSTFTALTQGIAGILVLFLGNFSPESWVIFTSLVLLMMGTGLMHATEDFGWPETLDHAGMHASLASVSLFLLGLPFWAILVGAVLAPIALEVIMDFDIISSVGVYILFCVVGGLVNGSILWLIAALASMGLGYFVWRKHTDLFHGLWHILTSLGFLFFFLAGL